jgi:hypothetical protein
MYRSIKKTKTFFQRTRKNAWKRAKRYLLGSRGSDDRLSDRSHAALKSRSRLNAAKEKTSPLANSREIFRMVGTELTALCVMSPLGHNSKSSEDSSLFSNWQNPAAGSAFARRWLVTTADIYGSIARSPPATLRQERQLCSATAPLA